MYCSYNVEAKQILFGLFSQKICPRFLIIYLCWLKIYIYDSKLSGNNVFFLSFLVVLKKHILIEKEISCKNNTNDYFQNNWQWLLEQMQNNCTNRMLQSYVVNCRISVFFISYDIYICVHVYNCDILGSPSATTAYTVYVTVLS